MYELIDSSSKWREDRGKLLGIYTKSSLVGLAHKIHTSHASAGHTEG